MEEELGKMKIEVIEVTPAVALEMLDKNKGNRSISDAKVRQYVRDIALGIIAWNRWNEGKESKLLRFGKGMLPMPKAV